MSNADDETEVTEGAFTPIPDTVKSRTAPTQPVVAPPPVPDEAQPDPQTEAARHAQMEAGRAERRKGYAAVDRRINEILGRPRIGHTAATPGLLDAQKLEAIKDGLDFRGHRNHTRFRVKMLLLATTLAKKEVADGTFTPPEELVDALVQIGRENPDRGRG